MLGLLQLLLQVQEGCWQQQLVMLSASSAAIRTALLAATMRSLAGAGAAAAWPAGSEACQEQQQQCVSGTQLLHCDCGIQQQDGAGQLLLRLFLLSPTRHTRTCWISS